MVFLPFYLFGERRFEMIANEYGRLRQVAVRTPSVAYGSQQKIDEQWQRLRYCGAPDFARAKDEHAALVALLSGVGAEVVELGGPADLTLDAVYTRDATVVTPKGLVLCNMGRPSRNAEPALNAGLMRDQLGLPILGEVGGEGVIEGGDVIWLDEKSMAVGRGVRTNDQGIKQLKAMLGSDIDVEVIPLPEPRHPEDVFHLMMIISPLDADLALVHAPSIPDSFAAVLNSRGIQRLAVPEDEYENMACNVLALGPREVVMLEGLPTTKALLTAAGCRVHTYPGQEISFRGEGGATCLSLPLSRQA